MEQNLPQQLWPGWNTVRVLGHGSYGAVYEIERDIFGEIEKAALKTISIPQHNSEVDDMFSDGMDSESITLTFRSYLQNIVSEYSLMRKLNGCANVVNCDDLRYIQHDDGIGWDVFIRMELLTPLGKALNSKVTDGQVIRIGMDLCRALALCRKHNIIHRDIKPANIFLSPNGDYKLGDFGIAKTIEKASSGTKAGTYDYMAPEVYYDQPYGHAADIYSLGIVLYWLLNERRVPFLPLPPEVPTAAAKEQARKTRFSGAPIPAPVHGSRELQRIVLKACAFDPAMRYATADELLRDLSVLAAAMPAEEAVPAPEKPVLAPLSVATEPDAKDEDTLKSKRKAAVTPPEPLPVVGLSVSIPEPAADVSRAAEPEQPAAAAVQATVHPEPEDEGTLKTKRKPATAPEGVKTKKSPRAVLLAVAALVVAVVGIVLFLGFGKAKVNIPSDPTKNFMLSPGASSSYIWGQTKHTRDEVTAIRFTTQIDAVPRSAWDISKAQDRTIVAWLDKEGVLTIASAKKVRAPQNSTGLFRGFSKTTSIAFNGCFDTSAATDMTTMFSDCKSLTSLNLTSFNTLSVEEMDGMFRDCSALRELDLSSFDTARVTSMEGMFESCENLLEIQLSDGFDTASVTDISYMFSDCLNLEGDFDFDYSSVTKYDHFLPDGWTIDGRAWQKYFESRS